MATLTVIADPFPDWEAETQAACARDLAKAIADTAPRSCGVRYLLSRGADEPEFTSPVIRIDRLPMRAQMLPLLWKSGATARPFDGEFVHSLTPLVPLRSRGEDDGSQTSVTVPHSIAWELPALLGNGQARLYRSFARRAVKLADVIVTGTHATAHVLQECYGADLPVQVLQLAPPTEFLKPADAAERRAALGLPDSYALTTAPAGEHGRLEWIFDAMRADPGLPPVVVIDGLDPYIVRREKDGSELPAVRVPDELAARVLVVRPRELADVGAIIAGARLMLQPQAYTGSGTALLGALAAGVPVLHSGHAAAAEIVLDAGAAAPSANEFAAEFGRLFRDPETLARLAVLALDRGRGYSWRSAAWQLWETHANL